jgi:MFS family permease
LAAAGPFWSLHHDKVPPEDRAISIAAVNCIGNLGGFVGPYLRGALADALGPRCPPVRHDCVGQWGWGTVIMGGGALLLSSALAIAACARLRPSWSPRAQR